MATCYKPVISILILIIPFVIQTIHGFNLSPKPNIVLKEPKINMKPQARSSYFGFSLNLRGQSVIVGAPRAQSSIELQRNIDEPGAIYKCSLSSGSCSPFIFEGSGNTQIEGDNFAYNSEKRDNQWLGACMDGGPKETDRFVVCAPRLVATVGEPVTDYLLHGICYWVPNTLGNKPTKVTKIAPLRLKGVQVLERGGQDNKYYYHIFGEGGLSVHITEDNEEILIGAPGVHTWKGSIIRYYATQEGDVGLSRRDIDRTKVSKRSSVEYVSDTPNPELWRQTNDSYFGYDVSSGFFEGTDSKTILYVASAPQANWQTGAAYLFDIVNSQFAGQKTIKIYYQFIGKQFGEYFGYSVLCEDFNGDGLTDVAISAPLYKTDSSFENGAVYIFMNKGKLYFELGQVLTTKNTLPGRFGTTLTKLGDINNDGYKDLAVGAPFENDGSVYIFLGSQRGLVDKPSQIVKDPLLKTANTQHMFGHGLSKGADIDGNGYNDLAIGAPNAEEVYVYKTYPVVKIIGSVIPTSREIGIDQTRFSMKACFQLEYNSNVGPKYDQNIKIVLKIDSKLKRATFSGGKNQIEFNSIATEETKCSPQEVNIKFSAADVFKPIEIEMQYELMNKIPDSEVFCDKCVAVNPFDADVSTEKIVFSTGCKSSVCIADLKIRSDGIKPTFILGSSRTLSITYHIINNGETAYLPQINVTTSNEVPFAKIPPSCKEDNFVLICDLFKGHPMSHGHEDTLTVVFDVTYLDGNSLHISAEVLSTGAEQNTDDNYDTQLIQLQEFSAIDVTGQAVTPVLNLEDGLRITEVVNTFEIRNNGPSTIKQMSIIIAVPVSYRIPNSENRISVIDFSDIKVNATYNKRNVDVTFTQNDTILVLNTVERSSTPSLIVDNFQDIGLADIGHSLTFDLNQYDTSNDDVMNNIMTRRRRELTSHVTHADYVQISQRQSVSPINNELSGKLPVNRTIYFNCNNEEETLCIEAKLNIFNFQPGNNIVSIMVRFKLDLEEISKILLETKDFFVITTSLDIEKPGEEIGQTIKITKTLPHNIISKHPFYSTPIWIYIVSVLGGILLLVLITYGMYKAGFFRRQKKEELQQLYRESHRGTMDDTEDED